MSLPKQTKREVQKASTRQKIIDTAYVIYGKNGFTATTSMIAKEAGISHGSLFLHFPTLNDLLLCLIYDFSARIGQQLHYLSESQRSVENLLRDHLKILIEYESFYTSIIADIHRLPDEIRNIWGTIQATTAFHFNKVIEYEKEKGTIKNIPVHMIFNTWMGLIHYYLLNKDFFSKENESVLVRYENELVQSFLEFLLIKAGEG